MFLLLNSTKGQNLPHVIHTGSCSQTKHKYLFFRSNVARAISNRKAFCIADDCNTEDHQETVQCLQFLFSGVATKFLAVRFQVLVVQGLLVEAFATYFARKAIHTGMLRRVIIASTSCLENFTAHVTFVLDTLVFVPMQFVVPLITETLVAFFTIERELACVDLHMAFQIRLTVVLPMTLATNVLLQQVRFFAAICNWFCCFCCCVLSLYSRFSFFFHLLCNIKD